MSHLGLKKEKSTDLAGQGPRGEENTLTPSSAALFLPPFSIPFLEGNCLGQ